METRADAVIVGAARTPVGKLLGALADVTAPQLGSVAVRAALERSGVDPRQIDEVYLGNVVSAGLGQAPARQASIGAGIPSSIPTTTINKVCGSGLKAVMLAAQAIRAGDGTVYIAGGMESMSNAPYLLPRARSGYRLGHQQVLDANIRDGLWCSFVDQHMGVLAEHIAEVYGVSRAEQDRFALNSHRKAVEAQRNGSLADEIVPVEVRRRRGAPLTVAADETPRPDTSLEALANLVPVFRDGGSVTAGNAPGLSDGAAALVVMERRRAEQARCPILARIIGYATAALDPKLIFAAPPLAIRAVLDRTGLTLDDFDLIEVNEAFAAQIVANQKELGLDSARLNVNGGAIALGHPLGATGARILVTLVHALRRRGLKRGLVALCLGGGGSVALAIEA